MSVIKKDGENKLTVISIHVKYSKIISVVYSIVK